MKRRNGAIAALLFLIPATLPNKTASSRVSNPPPRRSDKFLPASRNLDKSRRQHLPEGRYLQAVTSTNSRGRRHVRG